MFNSNTPNHHHLRFYVVVITLVVGAIFLFLFINNDKEGLSLTSAFVGADEKVQLDTDTTANEGSGLDFTFSKDNTPETAKTDTQKVVKGVNKIDFTLKLDKVPYFDTKADVEDLSINFNDLSTIIKINNDKLELNNLNDVNLRIIGFSGDFGIEPKGASVDGTAKRIEVNDIALSSKGEIKISFENLDYNSLSLSQLDLDELILPPGEGSLAVEEKLTYLVQNEEIGFYKYSGSFTLNNKDDTLVVLDGTTNGISLQGEELNLKLN